MSDYEQYKYLKVALVLIAETVTEQIPKIEGSITFYSYDILVGDKLKKRGKSRIPPYKPKKDKGDLKNKIVNLFKIPPEKCAAFD